MSFDREDLITKLCYAMRHDYGLEKEASAGFLAAGMSDVERQILRRQMAQLVDNVIEPLIEELTNKSK